MTALMEKIHLVLASEVTPDSVSKLVNELDTDREQLIFKAKLRQQNKLTPEIEEVFTTQGV